jgi:hypothetical protein
MCSSATERLAISTPGTAACTSSWTPELAEAAVTAGWAEVHPVALAGLARRNRVMLYGPRNEAEADTIFGLIAAAVQRAAGHQAQKAAQP